MSVKTDVTEMRGKRRYAEYQCTCGTKYFVRNDKGKSDSCGCVPINTRHGMSRTPTWLSWKSMWARCTDDKGKDADSYVNRGITVCDSWILFENFLTDMGVRLEGTSLDRIDNDSDYCPENCRWATTTDQANNKRNTIYATIDGQTKPLTVWCKELNIVSHNTALKRIEAGWSAEKAITHPVRHIRTKVTQKA